METVVEIVDVAGRRLELERPAHPEALLDDEAFGSDEFLPYWAEAWPSGLVLAAHLADRSLVGLDAIELGCGLALPSLVAAAGGAAVVATDWAPDALELARENARRNGLVLGTRQLDWRAVPSDTETFDLLLAADVLYEARNAAPVLDCIERLVRPGGTALIADPGRRHAGAFLDLATSAGWVVGTTRATGLPRGGIYELRSS